LRGSEADVGQANARSASGSPRERYKSLDEHRIFAGRAEACHLTILKGGFRQKAPERSQRLQQCQNRICTVGFGSRGHWPVIADDAASILVESRRSGLCVGRRPRTESGPWSLLPGRSRADSRRRSVPLLRQWNPLSYPTLHGQCRWLRATSCISFRMSVHLAYPTAWFIIIVRNPSVCAACPLQPSAAL